MSCRCKSRCHKTCDKKKVTYCQGQPGPPGPPGPPGVAPTQYYLVNVIPALNTPPPLLSFNEDGTILAAGYLTGPGLYSYIETGTGYQQAGIEPNEYTFEIASSYNGYPGQPPLTNNKTVAVLINRNGTNNMVLYGYIYGSTSFTTLDSVPAAPRTTSVTIGFNGDTYVFFDPTQQDVKYRYYDNGVWTTKNSNTGSVYNSFYAYISPDSSYPSGKLIMIGFNNFKLRVYPKLDATTYAEYQLPQNSGSVSSEVGFNYDASLIAVCAIAVPPGENNTLYVFSHKNGVLKVLFQTKVIGSAGVTIGDVVKMSSDGKVIVMSNSLYVGSTTSYLVIYKSQDNKTWEYSQTIPVSDYYDHNISPVGNRLGVSVTGQTPSVQIYEPLSSPPMNLGVSK